MTKSTKIIIALILLTAFIGGIVIGVFTAKNDSPLVKSNGTGAIGSMKIEDYLPVILYNDGLYTERDMQTTKALTVGTTLNATGAATLSSSLSVAGATTLTGTTTITQSVDGLVIGGTISTAATGTAVTVYTNSTGPKICDSGTGYLYVKNNGSFAPSLVWSLGTSTSAAVATTNLIASSTVATTTTSYRPLPDSTFLMDNGDTLVAIFADYNQQAASSTYFGNWSAEAGVWCQDVSI